MENTDLTVIKQIIALKYKSLDELNRRGYRTKSRNHAGKNVGGRLFVANDVRRI